MTLAEYLRQHGMTDTAFAIEIGVTSEAVRRYRSQGRIPAPRVMESIIRATKGRVLPNDFLSESILRQAESAAQ